MPSGSTSQKAQLFYSDGSPYARICRMIYREGGLSDQVQEVVTTLRDPDAAVLPYSAAGRVPALVLPGGTAITETTLILSWFDRHGCQPKMIPQDDISLAEYGRALGLMDGVAVWNRELRRPENERSPSVLELERVRANRIADVLETEVANGAYQKLNAGYFALAAILGYAHRRHSVWNWREGRTALGDWFDQASQRASFKATIPAVTHQ